MSVRRSARETLGNEKENARSLLVTHFRRLEQQTTTMMITLVNGYQSSVQLVILLKSKKNALAKNYVIVVPFVDRPLMSALLLS